MFAQVVGRGPGRNGQEVIGFRLILIQYIVGDIRGDLELLEQRIAIAGWTVEAIAEQVLIKHGFDFILRSATSLLAQIISFPKLTKYLERGPLRAATSQPTASRAR